MILIGWFNITTHIKFGEKGKTVYIIVFILAPLGIILGILGAMEPDFTMSIVISMIFLGGFLLLLGFIIAGFFTKTNKIKT